jgi:hypothetical protein
LAEAERGVERSQTEAGFHGVGKFPTEHEAAEPPVAGPFRKSMTATK